MTDKPKTASEYAKAAGLKSLKQATEMTFLGENALRTWFKTRPALFKIIIAGCVASLQDSEAEK